MAKRKLKKDPYQKREAKKYKNPIVSREFILNWLEQQAEPAQYEDMLRAFKLKEEDQQEALRRRLIAMSRDGQLIRLRNGRYGLVSQLHLISGVVQGHKDGHGFLIPDHGGEDLFLSPKQMSSVFDGDKVLARIDRIGRKGKPEAAIVEVLERKHHLIVGRYYFENGVGFVEPDNQRINHLIIIPKQEKAGAKSGQIVEAEITQPPSRRAQAMGRIVNILGEHMAAGMEVDVAIRAHQLPFMWPQGVDKALAKYGEHLKASDYRNREDLRDMPFVTIDGEDARDFDDAVYVKPVKRGGWRLYVAIADVSHYVKPETILDQEALTRGNSVYFPHRVIPMLPEVLSNGLCSLNPYVDRLSLVCEMEIKADGQLKTHQFYPAVIHSHARLTYTQVAEMLDAEQKTFHEQYAEIFPHIQHLHDLYKALHKARKRLGSLEFEVTEPYFIFDDELKIKQLLPRQRNTAHRIIEECMLCANVAAARFLISHDYPAIFRVHMGPKPEKLQDLQTFLGELGIHWRGGLDPQPSDYAELIERVASRPDGHMIQTVLLRSMQQAIYTTENDGHFGLAFSEYVHFTSPIRRYPDLMVHRAIKAVLADKSPKKTQEEKLEDIAVHCSMTERRADEATRDVVAWLKCEFMLDKIGQVYEGVVSGVTGFGIFVELRDIFVEGLVHVTALDNDYYRFDPVRHRLIGERTRKTYVIGDLVQVRVERVSLDDKQIDFSLLERKPKNKKKQRKK